MKTWIIKSVPIGTQGTQNMLFFTICVAPTPFLSTYLEQKCWIEQSFVQTSKHTFISIWAEAQTWALRQNNWACLLGFTTTPTPTCYFQVSILPDLQTNAVTDSKQQSSFVTKNTCKDYPTKCCHTMRIESHKCLVHHKKKTKVILTEASFPQKLKLKLSVCWHLLNETAFTVQPNFFKQNSE